jgi:hypothetical protein
MPEHGGRLRDACGRLEDRVGLARDEIRERFGALGVRCRRIDPHQVARLGDDVSPRSQRMRQRFELAARHEQVDVDRRAESAVIAHGDAADQRVVGSDLPEDLRELREGSSALVQGLQRMVGDARGDHEPAYPGSPDLDPAAWVSDRARSARGAPVRTNMTGG